MTDPWQMDQLPDELERAREKVRVTEQRRRERLWALREAEDDYWIAKQQADMAVQKMQRIAMDRLRATP